MAQDHAKKATNRNNQRWTNCEGKSSPSYRPEVAWPNCSVVSTLSSLALSAQLTCLLGFFQECFRYLQLRNIRAPSSRSMTNDLVDPSSAILACLTVPEMFHFFVSMSCTRTTSPSRKSLGALLPLDVAMSTCFCFLASINCE